MCGFRSFTSVLACGWLGPLVGAVVWTGLASAEPSPATESPTPSASQPAQAETGTPADSLPSPSIEPAAPPGTAIPEPPPTASPPPQSDVANEGTITPLLEKLDRVLEEAAVDLQLRVDWLAKSTSGPVDEQQLQSKAQTGWAIAPQLFKESGNWILRLTVVAPKDNSGKSQRLFVLRQKVDPQKLEVSAIRALRELTQSDANRQAAATPPALPPQEDEAARSPGKAELAVHGALVGAYVGYAMEHVGGSGDARLVYPLMTIGAGAGVGASLVIAEEWDISEDEARYMWAAGTWPTLSALLIASGRGVDEENAHLYGVLGATTGLSLGAVALSTGDLQRGGDELAHSGAVFGALLGGLGEMMVEGNTKLDPFTGTGLGMGIGVLTFGAIAPHVSVSPSRVLFVNLSATLGALAGAALASPVLVGERVTHRENRIFLGATAAGTLLGAGVGIWLTQDRNEEQPKQEGPVVHPSVGVLRTPTIRTAPGTLPSSPLPASGFVGLEGSF